MGFMVIWGSHLACYRNIFDCVCFGLSPERVVGMTDEEEILETYYLAQKLEQYDKAHVLPISALGEARHIIKVLGYRRPSARTAPSSSS